MARTDDEVVRILRKIYKENFGGKRNQRFLISWAQLRGIYGFAKLFNSRFAELQEAASRKQLYIWDLGEGDKGRMIAVIRVGTVDRWRRVPRSGVLDEYEVSVDAETDDSEDDDSE